tara:strand:- start:50 stop:457 length:408 start_codon:yes stop_codon:yes gene_type:complete
MFSKSIIWSTIVVSLFFYFVPPLFYTVADACLSEYVINPIDRDSYYFGILGIGVLLFSYTFVRVFQKWSNGIYSNKKGFAFGIWATLFTIASMSFINYATTDFAEAEYYALDSVYWLAMYTIGGVLVAFVSRKTS